MMLKRRAPIAKPGRTVRAQLAGRTQNNRVPQFFRTSGALLVSALVAIVLAAGCLDRPVSPQIPQTSNVFVAELRQTAVDKIDLLFMIDNSISMADKQQILGDAVSNLMTRLVTPQCVDAEGMPIGNNNNADASGHCANGSPEFSPIKDIHIGVVSSSLGSHGANSDVCAKPEENDNGNLVPIMRKDPNFPVVTWNNDTSGFLAWDPDTAHPRNTPPGESRIGDLTTNFRNMVLAVGQTGCGFEAQLESWYRFLVDPEPILSVPTVTDTSQKTMPVYSSDANTNPVLQQRARFLRQDSLVAIIMLSDENDCSIRDDGQGYLVGFPSRLPRATSACDQNPNSPCCTSCAAGNVANCPATASDANCAKGAYAAAEDQVNLRCYEQKRRFGLDLLYPTQRYVDGLWETTILNREGAPVRNPLYMSDPPRDQSLVFLAGIVGVPWQDIADPTTIDGPTLRYMTYDEMSNATPPRWDTILGSRGDTMTPPTPPGDKLMYETPADRTTLFGTAPHPVAQNAALAPASATGTPNAINGHESNITDGQDLQYACIFKLPTPVDCGPNSTAKACDCTADDQGYNRPLCQGTQQIYAKAYPGVRELQVLHDYGQKGSHNSIVASICPKSLDKSSPAYGYGPAVSAIVDRLKEALRGKCLPRQLEVDGEGHVPCAVVEASIPPAGSACDCSANPGRQPASDELRASVIRQLNEEKHCGDGSTPCENYCLCEIQQLADQQLAQCQTAPIAPSDQYGYCYVDPSSTMDGDAKAAMAQIVASCPQTQQRLLRFTGDNVPARGSIAMIACLGATLHEDATAAAP